MSCCGCGGTVSQVLRTTGVCCPTLDLANNTAILTDADGNTLTIGSSGGPTAVTLTLAGDQLTVGVDGVTATETLALPGVPDVVTVLTYDANGVLSYQNETGAIANIDLSALINVMETNTTLVYDVAAGILTYTSENGTVSVLDLSGLASETLTMLSLQGDVLDYSDENGVLTQIDLSGFRETETTIAFNPLTQTLTYTPESAVAIPLDLSSLEHVTVLAFDPATSRLTYTDETGAATIADLSTLIPIAIAATQTVTLTGNGATATPLTATVVIDPAAANLLTAGANGLVSQLIRADTDTINFAGDGSAAAPLQANVNVSAQAGNTIQALADGLFADNPAPNATIDLGGASGTELNLRIDGNIVSTVDLRTAAPDILLDVNGNQLGRLLPV